MPLQALQTQAQELRAPVSAQDVDAELISGLYRRVKPLLIANLGALSLLSISLWESADRTHLVTWAVVLTGWTMLRFGLAKLYLRRPRAPGEARYWIHAFSVGSGVAGALWGSSILLIESLQPDNVKLVTAFLMAALSAAAIAGYTNSLLAFGCFVVPALLPYGIRLVWLNGQPSWIIAAFVVFWALLLWSMARHLNDGFKDSIALALQNQRLIAQLSRARDKAEAANLAKTRFLGNMSHELRTPLNAIVGYSQMIVLRVLGPLGNAKYDSYAQHILDSGNHLLDVVNQVMDLSRLEAGKIDLQDDRIDVGELVRGAAAYVEPAAREDAIDLQVDVPAGLPDLTADSAKLRQVLLNLLSNAVKFTPQKGRIAVAATMPPQGGLAITVSDSGIGIPAEHLERVTTPFLQLEDQDHLQRLKPLKTDVGQTGTGLGLPLAKLLTELHGGTFTLTSRLGAGTSATVWLPPHRLVESKPAPAAQTRAVAE
jgi:signal transduction histidine kinase